LKELRDIKIDSIRLSQQSRDQLIRLKRITGIEQWNTLCRWAFCLSLSEDTDPPKTKIPSDSSVEMTWKTFAGEHEDLYHALLIDRAQKEGGEITKDTLLNCLRAHITRGIVFLTARKELKDIAGLLREVA